MSRRGDTAVERPSAAPEPAAQPWPELPTAVAAAHPTTGGGAALAWALAGGAPAGYDRLVDEQRSV
ncbi:MAG: hypothetical protein U0Q15_00180 [Kineosporiaceae bacterium]